MADLPNVGDLARVVMECCSSPTSLLNMIGRVAEIEKFETACDECGDVHRGPHARIPELATSQGRDWFPLHWFRRVPPLEQLESVDIADELSAERPRERVSA